MVNDNEKYMVIEICFKNGNIISLKYDTDIFVKDLKKALKNSDSLFSIYDIDTDNTTLLVLAEICYVKGVWYE